jgi:hypothetical protein
LDENIVFVYLTLYLGIIMVSVMNINSLKTGDLIVRKKGPFSTHYIVWIGWRNGQQIVAENQFGHGVRYTTLEEALAGNPIVRFEKFGGTENQRLMVLPRIDAMLGKPYNLISFNCEHFGRMISTGKKESKQINTLFNWMLLVGGAMLLSKSRVVRGLGAFCLFVGGLAYAVQFLNS